MRFILSIIILTLLITYAIIPAVKWLRKFAKKEGKRIDKEFLDTNTNLDKEKDDM